MARNPLLLTTLTIIHQKKNELPRKRVLLYHEAVDLLASRWRNQQAGRAFLDQYKTLRPIVEDAGRMRSIMERLAFEAHVYSRDKETRDLPRSHAQDILKDVFGEFEEFSEDRVEQISELFGLPNAFLDYVDQHSGLLIGQGGEEGSVEPSRYSFPHRTYQEYLAGCYLLTTGKAVRELKQRATEGDYWSVAVQLGTEDIMHRRDLAATLITRARQLTRKPATTEADYRMHLWAGRMLREVGKKRVEDTEDGDDEESGAELLDKVLSHLVACLDSPLPPIERTEAGDVLAMLGDPRVDVMNCVDMAFCPVPRGEFWMGSDTSDDLSQDDERPLHRVHLDYDYWVGRYPVTVAQFREYLDARGIQPRDPDALKDPDNHPVRWVYWDEASAFCEWLTDRLKRDATDRRARPGLAPEESKRLDALSAGQLVARLPSEAEWEKAARGMADHRRYPWGEKAEINRMNIDLTGIRSTSAVGAFPEGKSLFGALEMSGNVWEWTRDWYDSDWYKKRSKDKVTFNPVGPTKGVYRSVRGGSFYNLQLRARCAYRSWNNPDDLSNNVGFRVVLLPFPD